MAQEARHVFTKQEGGLGVKNSRLGRKAWMKFEQKLARLNLEKETVSKLLELAKVIIAQPGGVFLIGWLAVDGLERIGYFGSAGKAQASGTQTPASPKTPASNSTAAKSSSAANSFINLIAQSLPPGLGDVFAFGGNAVSNAIAPGTGTASGQLGTDLSGLSGLVGTANVDAAFLKTGLFVICLTQALGGGQGIATLGTAAIAALK